MDTVAPASPELPDVDHPLLSISIKTDGKLANGRKYLFRYLSQTKHRGG
jgi:hypothetical protein